MDTNGPSNSSNTTSVVEQILNKLQQTGEMTINTILAEFISRANRGEILDKEELLKHVPSEMRVELAEELDFVQGKIALGKTYMKKADEVARKMLEELTHRLGRSLTTADVLMEFSDRANRGEPVNEHAVLANVDGFLDDNVSPEKRAKLSKNLAFANILTGFGKTYREHKS